MMFALWYLISNLKKTTGLTMEEMLAPELREKMDESPKEKTDKEKRSTVTYLVNAGSFNGAVKNIEEVMGGTMIDYVIASVSETAIMDVYEYGKSEKKDDKPEYEE